MRKDLPEDNDADLLRLLKQPPPAPEDEITKTLIDILESGGSLEDFPFTLEAAVFRAKFIRANLQFLSSVKDISIADEIEVIPPGVEVLRVPKEVIRNLNAYLTMLKDRDAGQLKPEEVLARLPYWPYGRRVFQIMYNAAVANANKLNEHRWAKTLRALRAEDCPLGDYTKKVSIDQCRLALAYLVTYKNIPRLLSGWQKHLGFPRNEKRGWHGIVKNLVDYLKPFFPTVVRRGNARSYVYNRVGKSGPAPSRKTFVIVAYIMHLAYPLDWPSPKNAKYIKRLKNCYHSYHPS